jgi:hypothetical protein
MFCKKSFAKLNIFLGVREREVDVVVKCVLKIFQNLLGLSMHIAQCPCLFLYKNIWENNSDQNHFKKQVRSSFEKMDKKCSFFVKNKFCMAYIYVSPSMG